MNEEKYEPALFEFNNAIKANPKFADSYYQRGRCYLYLNKNTDAKKDLDKAVELDPDKAMYYNTRGLACENLGDTLGAISNFKQAISKDSMDFRPYYNMSRTLEGQQKPKEALAFINAALQKNPADGNNYVTKGSILQALKDTVAAINVYETALRVDSNSYGANYSLSILYNEKGKFKQALKHINRAINADIKNPEGYVERGLILENLKDTVEALKNYNKAIELDNTFSFAYFTRGSYYQIHGNSTAAIADFSKMINLDPNDADAYVSRAECYSDTDNCASAILDLEVAKKLTPNDPDVHFQIGICQDETRYYREAIESFSKAISIDSTASEYFYSRGNSYYNLELLDVASKDYFQALKLDSTSAGPYFNLGNIHFDKKEFDLAIKYYDKYLLMEPKDSDALVNRGICKNGLGLEKEACEDWKAAAVLNSFEAKENLKKFCK
ncbi:MAG: tetratricopeptide repeat protein [Bacteroidia bacterium]|nr:tetratricopeptide repeat protein [Bacteroidia bacterium]